MLSIKKVVSVTALAALGLPSLASADTDTTNVTVYGVADVSYDLVNNGNGPTAATRGAEVNKVSSNASRIGLKGSEDLGDGLSAQWQVESLVAFDNAGGTFATRNTYAGLNDKSWGTVLFGRYDTPYKLSTRKLDVFADHLADNRSLLGGVAGKSAVVAFDGRQPDIAVYISPAVNGFTGALAYVAGAETATTSSQTKGSAYSLAGWYGADSLYVSLAHEVHDFGSTGTGDFATVSTTPAGAQETASKLGAGYTINAFSVNAVYEHTNDNASATHTDLYGHNAYYVSGIYSFGNDAVKLAYTKSGNVADALDTGAKEVALGYDHSLSKRTTLYALYTNLSNESKASYGLSSATVADGTAPAAGAGAKLAAWSFGLKHTF